jgi:N-acetylmuramoyl-L-alanine amidase
MVLPPRAAMAVGRRAHQLVAALWVLLLASTALAEGARIVRLRHFSGPEHTRIVLDLDRACSFEVRRVEEPDRIAVNVTGAVFAFAHPGDRTVGDGLVRQIRCNAGDGRAQIVIDLEGRREFRAFSLPPVGDKPDRIVIDVLRAGAAAPPVVTEGPGSGTESVPPPPESRPAEGVSGPGGRVVADTTPAEQDSDGADGGRLAAAVPDAGGPAGGGTGDGAVPDGTGAAAHDAVGDAAAAGDPGNGAATGPGEEPFVVIVDAGHGGDDPGAMRGGLQEKDITLDISREVARQLRRLPGYRVVLTRDRDRFVPLGRRVEIARQQKGDVFVSVHCNTHPRPVVAGMEVYFLTLQGASDREARELADAENAADLVGLPRGEDHPDLVMDILMDLKMTRVLQDSGRLAAALLGAADRSGVVSGRRVKQAEFLVLKNLAMPSALVEVAYLSNDADRRLLGDPAGRRRVAEAIVAGIEDWRRGTTSGLARPAPVVAAAALRQRTDRLERPAEEWPTVYRVRSGDSLWKLADRYGTTMNEIARRNRLSERERELRIGQRLRLPSVGARP